MARNTLTLELSGFEELITKLEKLGGDVQKATTDALEQAAETIEFDTKDAVKDSLLPAGGKYSRGDTERSIVSGSEVKWSGSTAEISVGFDYGKQGAGGFLITGTPRMKPDMELKRIYKGATYKKQIVNDLIEVISDYIDDKMGGR